jgi:hypothetical protein
MQETVLKEHSRSPISLGGFAEKHAQATFERLPRFWIGSAKCSAAMIAMKGHGDASGKMRNEFFWLEGWMRIQRAASLYSVKRLLLRS